MDRDHYRIRLLVLELELAGAVSVIEEGKAHKGVVACNDLNEIAKPVSGQFTNEIYHGRRQKCMYSSGTSGQAQNGPHRLKKAPHIEKKPLIKK